MKKRLLSLLLIGCMLLPLLPALPMQAGAAAPTLGQIGSSTTLYDDIVLGETALPMTYQDFLAASVEVETPQTAYKKYLMETPSVTWKGDWSLGAMIDGEYEPIEYIVFMQGKTLESNSLADNEWMTNASGYSSMIDAYLAGAADCGIWSTAANGNVGHSYNTNIILRMPPSGNVAASGVGAYCYTVPSAGYISLSASLTNPDSHDTGFAFNTPTAMYLAVAVNGTVIFPAGATFDNRASWGNYATMSDLKAALESIDRFQVKAGDQVQICIAEKEEGNNPKLGIDPIVYTYESGEAASGTANQFTATAKADRYTVNKTVPATYSAWAAAQGSTDGTYEKINRRAYPTAAKIDTTTQSWGGNARWHTTAADYKEMVEAFVNGKTADIWASGHAVHDSNKTPKSSFRCTGGVNATVFAYTYEMADSGLVGFQVNTDASTILQLSNMYIAVAVDGTIVWPENATLANADNWKNYTTVEALNVDLATVIPYVEAGELVQLCIRAATQNADYALDPILNFYSSVDAVKELEGSLELGVSFALNLHAVYENETVLQNTVLTLNGQPVSPVATRNVDYSYNVIATKSGIAAKEMSDTVEYAFTNKFDGHVYQSGSLSLAGLLGQYLVYNGGEIDITNKQSALVVATLNYGAAAQNYFGYNTENLANAALPAALQVTASSIKDGSFNAAAAIEAIEGATLHWNSATLLLDDVLRLNKDLYVVNESGEPLATLEEALRCLDHQVIPVFSPAADAYDALKAHFEANKYGDVMLLSNNVEKIAALKAVQPKLYVIWDARTATVDTLPAMRASAATAGAYICLLPAELATMENTTYCTLRHLIPWYEAASSSDTESVRLLTAGACGILTENRAAVEACICNDEWFAEGSLTRYVPIIGHQGSTFSNETQPNTIHGFDWAMSKGAKTVEFDVHLTKDEKLVLMHDTTIQGTTNGTGTIANMTLAEIQQYKVDIHTGAPAQPIPTFLDVLEWAKDKDIVLTIEIKAYSEKLVELVAEQIAQYELWDKCRVACGSDEMIKKMRELCPTVHAAFVSSTSLLSYDTIVSRALNANAAYFAKYDFYDYDLLEDLAHRGISTNLWTPDSDVGIYGSYAKNPWSLCLNYVDKMSDIPCSLYSMYDSYSLAAGGSTDVVLLADTYTTEASVDVSAAEMVIIEGNETLTYANGTLSATAAGKATVMFRMPVTLGSTDITVYIYSAPVTVQVD